MEPTTVENQMTAPLSKAKRATSRRRVLTAVAALGSAALAAGVLLTVLTGFSTSAVATSIPALAPADSDTFVVAPYSESWWKSVAAMAPAETGVNSLDLAAAGVQIKAVGYSRGTDHEEREVPMTGPLRTLYIEAADPDAAQKLAAWFRSAAGFEGRQVFVHGSTVVVAQSWVKEYRLPEKTMDTVAEDMGTMSSGRGSMYRSPDLEVKTLAGGESTDHGKAMTAVMRSGFGFTKDTTWLGTSTDGSAWEGDFRTGGVDPEQINFDLARNALEATAVKVAEVVDDNVKYEGFSSRAGEILMTSKFRSADGGTLGLAGGSAQVPPAVKGEVVSVVSDVTGWSSAASGIYSSRENIETQSVSASEDSMAILLTYGQGTP